MVAMLTFSWLEYNMYHVLTFWGLDLSFIYINLMIARGLLYYPPGAYKLIGVRQMIWRAPNNSNK